MKMSPKTIIPREFVKDVLAGMSDAVLQKKYRVSEHDFYTYKATVLDFIAKKHSQESKRRIQINAGQFLADLRSGLDDEALMIKYGLLPRQLQSVFRKMIKAGLITALEISNRLKITKSQVTEAFVEMGKAIKELD
jgi:hypothetical protein